MGKGSGRRPTIVDQKTFEDNWSKIFGGSNEQKNRKQDRPRPEELGPQHEEQRTSTGEEECQDGETPGGDAPHGCLAGFPRRDEGAV